MAKLGNERRRAAEIVLRCSVPPRRSALCDLESVRVDRAICRGGCSWKAELAVLDEISRFVELIVMVIQFLSCFSFLISGDGRYDWGNSIHVSCFTN